MTGRTGAGRKPGPPPGEGTWSQVLVLTAGLTLLAVFCGFGIVLILKGAIGG